MRDCIDIIEALLDGKENSKHVVNCAEAELVTEAKAVLRAAGAKPRPVTLSHAVAILAPRGHEGAALVMAIQLGWQPHADKTAAENLFTARHAIALIWAAYDAHTGYITVSEASCGKVAECATVIDPTSPLHKRTHTKLLTWFRETRAAEAHEIGEQLKVSMRRQGRRI
jgi:hypothetical protein